MTDAESHGPSYVGIWVWLVGLLVAGLAVAYMPVGKVAAAIVIFAVALVKAALVARHYMHLKTETFLIYAIVGVPLLLLVFMVVALAPDIIFNR
jgi:caa(3)-type oxidase subunit IV